jgi:hypothetical protein
MGAPHADPHGLDRAGAVYIIFGAPGLGSSGSLSLAPPDGVHAVVIQAAHAGQFVGISVAFPGDVNADGIDDMILGASGADPGIC